MGQAGSAPTSSCCGRASAAEPVRARLAGRPGSVEACASTWRSEPGARHVTSHRGHRWKPEPPHRAAWARRVSQGLVAGGTRLSTPEWWPSPLWPSARWAAVRLSRRAVVVLTAALLGPALPSLAVTSGPPVVEPLVADRRARPRDRHGRRRRAGPPGRRDLGRGQPDGRRPLPHRGRVDRLGAARGRQRRSRSPRSARPPGPAPSPSGGPPAPCRCRSARPARRPACGWSASATARRAAPARSACPRPTPPRARCSAGCARAPTGAPTSGSAPASRRTRAACRPWSCTTPPAATTTRRATCRPGSARTTRTT